MSNEERPQSDVTPQEVGDAAVSFMNELVTAFGGVGTAELSVDGIELDVQVHGDDLGLLVGPGGRTLNAVQDLVRVAAQRRLGVCQVDFEAAPRSNRRRVQLPLLPQLRQGVALGPHRIDPQLRVNHCAVQPPHLRCIAARAPRVDLALRRGHVDAQPSKVEVRGELSGESTRGGEAMQRR